ncbi:MAG: cell division protein FtsI [Lachnospiraceae bacterium]|nr:cell division protein FtsI [Lachnospiraceae bacterium]
MKFPFPFKKNSEETPKKKKPKVRIKYSERLQNYMVMKLNVFAIVVLILFVVLTARLLKITSEKGEQYKKQVLSQQKYDSKIIPYQRGSILDRNGTLLAYSEQVYNIILDSSMFKSEKGQEELEPTLAALRDCFGLDIADVRNFIVNNPDSKYHILKKRVTQDVKDSYELLRDAEESQITRNGIWFESEFKRFYPNGSLAADVIGFTTRDGIGQYGLEEYYNDVLAGNNGREYGYLSGDNALERTIIPAENGYSIVSTIDAHIQQICEENLVAFNEAHRGEYREGEDGANNSAVIIMDVNTGEVLAMASYPFYNLNDPYDLSHIYTQEDLALMETEGTLMEARNEVWKNFCISQSYEPGSVSKTFTIAGGIDCGALHDGDEYYCPGYISLGEGTGVTIHCHNRYGEGALTTQSALEQSCNVSLVMMNNKIGKKRFLEYFKNFNFGLKTNIDLAGEMRTAGLVFNEDTMRYSELATASFGQGFNVTMIEEISAFCSVVNGGYYRQPHMVSKIVDEDGATVQNIDPVLLRQPISESTSELMRQYLIGVVENGTGKYARPAGYRIGGKTGTAEHSGEGKTDYVISFMGFAPANDPQIAIYVVIDRPNVASQDTATRYACLLCREILQDVLPYKHIFMTEVLTSEEQKRLQEGTAHGNAVAIPEVVPEETDTEESTDTSDVPVYELELNVIIDKNTGYAIDPSTGEYLDPDTGRPINGTSGIIQDENGNNVNVTPGGVPVDDNSPF